jgi:hypothetical protein
MSADQHTRIISQLQALYGERLLQRRGATYPVIMFPAAPGQAVDDLLHPAPPTALQTRADYVIYDEAHLAQRQATRHLTNGLCYIGNALQHDPPQIRGALGYYFDMMATCDALDHELRDGAATPLRDALHAHIPLTRITNDLSGRCAVVGAAVLTVFKQGGEYVFFLVQRDPNLATGAGLFHVMPAFVMQPAFRETAAAEWSFVRHIVREYAEELFAMPELNHPTHFYQHPRVRELRAMLNDGRAELHPTGIAFNALSLRPELCAVLIIHDDWAVRNAAVLQAAIHTERQATHVIPLDTLDGLPDDVHTRIAPQGAAALWYGIDRARGIIGLNSG